MPKQEHIVHGIEPVFDRNSRFLVLGTMPSPKSREQGFFYGHPRNRFWKVLAAVYGEAVPQSVEEKKEMLLAHGIALWDVLESCDIEGASDASIKNPVANDLGVVLDSAPIEKIFCTGATATRLYRKLIEPVTGMPCEQLPSTSPANAAISLEKLIDIYKKAFL